MEERIKEIIEKYGYDWTEKPQTIHTTCPSCGQSDKFSILKKNGSCICYRGKCDFGRQWFTDWIVAVGNVSYPEARSMLESENPVDLIGAPVKNSILESSEQDPEILWPAEGTYSLEVPESKPGVDYLESRGVPLQVAQQYGIRYSISQERVILPVNAFDQCWGWQGRSINKNALAADRMRNNPGFRRGLHVMFADRLVGSKHAIIAEGPFDALKFHLAGGNVASLGKIVTDLQLKEILSYGVDSVYLALDEDAMEETAKLREKIDVNVYLVRVPGSCKTRCAALGKKPDFGECTFEEALRAFRDAEKIGKNYFAF